MTFICLFVFVMLFKQLELNFYATYKSYNEVYITDRPILKRISCWRYAWQPFQHGPNGKELIVLPLRRTAEQVAVDKILFKILLSNCAQL